MPPRRQRPRSAGSESSEASSWLLPGLAASAVAAASLAGLASTLSSSASTVPETSSGPGPRGSAPLDAGGSVLARLGLSRVLVLRLQRKPTRAAKLIEGAEELGVPLEMHDATDGLWNNSYRSQVLPLQYPEGTCADLVGAIFNTHERAWRIAAEAPLPSLLLEDDVRLPADFVELFSERMRALPEDFHVALAGSSVTPAAEALSELLSRPDAEDPNGQAFLGLWGYAVSPAGARQLLRLAEHARPGRRRLFQPVDLFMAHRLRHLAVYAMEPPAPLAEEFKQMEDIPILSTMRQVGVVYLTSEPSTNQPNEDEETSEMEWLSKRVVELGEQGKSLQSWKAARKALHTMRRYSCWHAAQMLQNAGVSLLRLLSDGKRSYGPAGFSSANDTLQACLEAFASSIRYTSGTWMERQKLSSFPEWVTSALETLAQQGRPVAPTAGWGQRKPLPRGGWLHLAESPEIVELLPPEGGIDLSKAGRFAD